jgi:hypothetical protein
MLGPIFRCDGCYTFFMKPRIVQDWFCAELDACPNCGSLNFDFQGISQGEINLEFFFIYGLNWTETERMEIRQIAESLMEPFNPLSREL